MKELSDRLYEFIKGWFVSNGYLVFTPDIHYTIGNTGKSAYNAVVSAVKYLNNISLCG